MGNITFEESTMTLTVRLLVCRARRSLYTLLKGYRETLTGREVGGERWTVWMTDRTPLASLTGGTGSHVVGF